jgi:DNA (cytosine-5)-methyltransferase 1
MKLLDLFAGAGGAAKGYQRAGFYVVGIDINPQPHYCGDEFHQADALEYVAEHGAEFDAIHASPPCQFYSTMTTGRWQDRLGDHPQLIKPIRELLMKIGKPYVIENVEGARKELINPILLCGSMFGLQTKYGNQLVRHRYFECSYSFILVPSCQHNKLSAIGVYGGGQNPSRKKAAVIGVYGHTGGSSNRADTAQFGIAERREAMGIDWMTNDELSEAIPPTYTEFIGRQLMQYLAGAV